MAKAKRTVLTILLVAVAVALALWINERYVAPPPGTLTVLNRSGAELTGIALALRAPSGASLVDPIGDLGPGEWRTIDYAFGEAGQMCVTYTEGQAPRSVTLHFQPSPRGGRVILQILPDRGVELTYDD